jgi:NADH:ubiquinone oxidoreductase subunit 3 (subunit A)
MTIAEPKWTRWPGIVLSGLVILFMLMDVTIKLLQLPIAVDAGEQLGWPAASVFPLGIVLLICTALYAFPEHPCSGRSC